MDLLQKVKDLEARLEQLERRRKVILDWTPTVTQSGAVTITINEAKYRRSNGLVWISAHLTMTGTGTGNNRIVIGGLPVTGVSSAIDEVIGAAQITDLGTIVWQGVATLYSTTTISFLVDDRADWAGVLPNFALAAGDKISFNGWYRV